jgi:hypothetical protein
VIVEGMHIQQVMLEAGEGEYQPKKHLEGDGIQLAQREVVAATLSQGEAEQQLSNEVAEWEYAAGWKVKATRDEVDGMGDHDDLPICIGEIQPRRLHEKSYPGEKLDEMI